MTSIELVQARRYVELLRGDSNQPVHWQLFKDNDKNDPRPVVFYCSLDDALDELNRRQQAGYGVYVTINPTNGVGRSINDIVSYDWVFADIDGESIPSDFPLEPAFVTQRDSTHGHVYWPISGCLTVKQYNYVQKLVALYLGSDEQVVDPSRVARLPGSRHMKDPSVDVRYSITKDNAIDFSYDYDEFLEAFVLPKDKQDVLDNWIANRDANTKGTGFNDNPIYRNHFIHFLTNHAEPAIEGSGSATLIRVAGYAFDRGISLEECQELMWEHYNPRCLPPWEVKDYDQFCLYVSNAYQFANNAPGCLTATASFGDMDTPEPPEGWEANEKRKTKKNEEPEIKFERVEGDIARISEEDAALNSVQITNKSPIFDQAIKFIGEVFPNKTLIRNDKVFYYFNGVHWHEIPDDKIKHLISTLFAVWKLTPSKVNNIFDIICHLVYMENVSPGKYMDGRKDVTDNIIMQNGIIQITQNGQWELVPHTSELFDLNALIYDYQPNASCFEFHKFINSQWPDDDQMHMQLQELYGLSLIHDNRHHLLPLFIGKSRSGKGVHSKILETMVGRHNFCSPSLESLIEDHTLNIMSSKKLAIIPEANAVHPGIRDRILNRLKSISSNDSLQYNRKYKDAAICSSWPLTIIASNEMPDFADPSGALANRIWAFPFRKSFAGKEDRHLADRLCSPDSIAGIFAWALEGLVRVIKNGKVTFAVESRELVEDIRRDTFPLSDFIEDCCWVSADDNIKVADLYSAYLIYSRSKGVKKPYMQSRFSSILKSSWLPVDKRRMSNAGENGKREYIFTGLKLNDETVENMQPASFEPVSNVTPINKVKEQVGPVGPDLPKVQ